MVLAIATAAAETAISDNHTLIYVLLGVSLPVTGFLVRWWLRATETVIKEIAIDIKGTVERMSILATQVQVSAVRIQALEHEVNLLRERYHDITSDMQKLISQLSSITKRHS